MTEITLHVMRLAEMHRTHPQQITGHCSECGHTVGIYPSGQAILQQTPGVKLVCNVCGTPGEDAMLAPGAVDEALQSVKKR